MQILHATCVCLDGDGILIRGPSGSGKSDLALRLLDRGALLVADDLVEAAAVDGRLVARLPAGRQDFAGALEVRGVGVLSVPHRGEAIVALNINLAAAVERLPKPAVAFVAGIAVRSLTLSAFEASASAKIVAALKYGFARVAA